ncbi:hypothetical protein ACU686_27220 [Yinghuangia aomiensis]
MANLAVVLIGATGCAVLAYWLFSRFDKLREPLNDRSLFYLWNQVRDPGQLGHIAQAAPGGAQFGDTALFGAERIPDPTLRGVFQQASAVTAGRIVSDGWTEAQWIQSANSRGQLGAPSFADAQQAASQAAAQAQAVPPQGTAVRLPGRRGRARLPGAAHARRPSTTAVARQRSRSRTGPVGAVSRPAVDRSRCRGAAAAFRR